MEQVVYCDAVLDDARLLRESLTMFEETIASLGPPGASVGVGANNRLGVEVSFSFAAGTDSLELVKVVVELTARIASKDAPDKVIVQYESRQACLFGVIRSLGMERNSTVPSIVFAPYVRQTAWIAARRAESGIAATGIAIQLNLPDVPMTEEVRLVA